MKTMDRMPPAVFFPRIGKFALNFSRDWKICIPLLLVGFSAMCPVWAGAPFYSNGFNAASVPGWGAVNVSGSAGLVSPVTSGSYPTCSPYEGTHMVQFNSYSCNEGNSVRWRMTNALDISTKSGLSIEFAWHRDSSYSDCYDYVVPEWSTNGTVWNELESVERYWSGGSMWTRVTNELPADVDAAPALYLAFRFGSGYGNNCYLDDLQVFAQPPGISSVTPAFGAITGGYLVAIGGRDFGGETAVTNVLLAGVSAILESQSATQVMVRAGAAPVARPPCR